MTLSIIVAMAENGVIGHNNRLLWHLPADLKWFKHHTTGHAVLMGRKTFESLGKPLPNRRNVVLTSQKKRSIEGCEVVNSLDEALDLLKNDGEIFVIGGGEVYRKTLPLAHRIYLTRVHQSFEGDTFFLANLNPSEWLPSHDEHHLADGLKNQYAYTFQIFERNKPSQEGLSVMHV